MSSISRFINSMYCWIYFSYTLHTKMNKNLQEPDWPFVSLWNLKSLFFTCFHSFITRCHSLYHLLSFVATSSHFLSLLPLAFICCHSCHSLPLIVPLVVIHCHSLHHSLSRDVHSPFLFKSRRTRIIFQKK